LIAINKQENLTKDLRYLLDSLQKY
jgi:hypothetical protein